VPVEGDHGGEVTFRGNTLSLLDWEYSAVAIELAPRFLFAHSRGNTMHKVWLVTLPDGDVIPFRNEHLAIEYAAKWGGSIEQVWR
jgi:hypothetical protein